MSINILNVFNQDAFGVVSLTDAINDITPQYGRLGAMGLFRDEGVTQRTAVVDFDPITNQLLPQSQWGGPGAANKTAVGRSRSYAIPHFPVNDSILAGDLQGRRRPGSDAMQDAQWLMAKKMREMKLKLEQTLEWMRLGVLKGGIVKDGNGTTILDIYGDFGISQTSTSFVLGTTTTDVMGKIAARKRAILAALRGELMSGFVALCSDTFYDAFVSHPNVKLAFTYYQNPTGQTLSGDYSGSVVQPNAAGLFAGGVRGFQFGDVVWINYTGSVTDSAGSSQPMIDADSAYMFPTGTDVFRNWYAPADYMETVNTEGLPFYAKQRFMEFDKGIQVECQSNPLPICLKPAVIQKLTIA
jgi:hypothetical protein